MSDEKTAALNKDISNFLKRLAPKELHTYIDDEQTETDIKIIPIEEHQKTKNLIQNQLLLTVL